MQQRFLRFGFPPSSSIIEKEVIELQILRSDWSKINVEADKRLEEKCDLDFFFINFFLIYI